MTAEPAAARSRHHRGAAAPAEHTAAKPKEDAAAAQLPLPQPRPASAPPRATVETAKAKDESGKDDGDRKAVDKEEAAAPPPPSACRVALTEEIAIAPSVPAIHGPGDCGGDDLVRLEAVVLPNKKRVSLTPAGIMRCSMATAVVNWIRDDVAPEVAKLGSEITALDNFDSYQCRGRNGVPSTKLSEHGHANAIDVNGFKLADGRLIELTDRTQPREFRENVLRSACTRFPTVLGPDSDWHHEDHIHLDLIERKNNYRICQWDVLDPMPKVAPLMPEGRPDDAPSREVAGAPAAGNTPKDQVAKGNASEPDAARANDANRHDPGHAGPDKPAKASDAAPGKDASGGDPRRDAAAGTGQSAGRSSGQASAPSNPATAPGATAKAAEGASGKGRPAVGAGKSAAAEAAPDKDAAARNPPGPSKTSSEKASSEKASAGKVSSETSGETASKQKASRKKVAADRPAPKRRRQRARTWNPFASFF